MYLKLALPLHRRAWFELRLAVLSSSCSAAVTGCLFPFVLGARFDDGAGGDNEVQRTMLELISQLDGFDPRGNIKCSWPLTDLTLWIQH